MQFGNMHLVLFKYGSPPEGTIPSGSLCYSGNPSQKCPHRLAQRFIAQRTADQDQVDKGKYQSLPEWVFGFPQVNGEVDYVITASLLCGRRPYHLLLIAEGGSR